MDNSFLIRLGLDTAQLVAGVNKSNQILSGFQSQVTSIGRTIAGGLGFYTLSAGIVNVAQSMAAFAHSMQEVKALTNATSSEFAQLRNNALNLAGAFKAIDISRLEAEFARLGFSTAEIIASTEATIALATATGSDLATSAVIAGSTLRAFGLDASNMGHVADVMAGALNRSGLDMSNFAEAIKYVAPNARAANISLEETAAILGILADNGIKGSMAGTTTRRIIQDLAKDSRPLIERLEELQAKGLSLADAFEEVGRIGSTGLLVLANNADKINPLAEALKRANGEAKAMSNIMQDDLEGDWNKLAATFDKTTQSGNFLYEALRKLTQLGNSFGETWNNAKFDDKGLMNSMLHALDGFSDKTLWNVLTGKGWSMPTVGSGQTGSGSADGPYPNNTLIDPLAGMHGQAPMRGPGFDAAGMSSTTSMLGTGWTSEIIKQTSAALKDLKITVNESSEAYKDFFGSVDMANDALALEAETIDPEVSAQTDILIEKHNKLKAAMVSTAITAQQAGRMLKNVYVEVLSGIGRAIGDMASGLSGSGIEKALLSTLGGIVTQIGEMALSIGIGLLKIRESLMTLNPYSAIAAGVGLIALGTYFTNKSAQIGSSMGGSESSSSPNSYTPSNQELTTRVSGTDLMLILQRQGAQNSFSKYP
jgi:hypothetical protein